MGIATTGLLTRYSLSTLVVSHAYAAYILLIWQHRYSTARISTTFFLVLCRGVVKWRGSRKGMGRSGTRLLWWYHGWFLSSTTVGLGFHPVKLYLLYWPTPSSPRPFIIYLCKSSTSLALLQVQYWRPWVYGHRRCGFWGRAARAMQRFSHEFITGPSLHLRFQSCGLL